MSSELTAAHWQRVETLFHTALERPAHERESFVEHEAGDADTARLVRAMLRRSTDAPPTSRSAGQRRVCEADEATT